MTFYELEDIGKGAGLGRGVGDGEFGIGHITFQILLDTQAKT